MYPDIVTLANWYASALGAQTLAYLKLPAPSAGASQRHLGIGYTAPFMDETHPETFWAMPAGMGGWAWPAQPPYRALLTDETALPFPDMSFDTICAVHALEFTANPVQALTEWQRTTKPNGQLHLIVPNRLGLWARREGPHGTWPFARGNPHSKGQLEKHLQQAGWTLETLTGHLYFPPCTYQCVLNAPHLWDTTLRRAGLPPGVWLATARKKMTGGTPVRVTAPSMHPRTVPTP